MAWKKLLFIAIIAYGAYHSWQSREVGYDSKNMTGEIASQDPIQADVYHRQIMHIKGYEIIPLASFSIQARILSREDYYVGREADLSPIDLALGWGPMSDDAVLSQLSIRQSSRFYYWHTDHFPIPREEIQTHSANMHMIPANDEVNETLATVRKGQIVSIEGDLVEAKASDGWHWKSSLSRNDTGRGACELILVKKVSLR